MPLPLTITSNLLGSENCYKMYSRKKEGPLRFGTKPAVPAYGGSEHDISGLGAKGIGPERVGVCYIKKTGPRKIPEPRFGRTLSALAIMGLCYNRVARKAHNKMKIGTKTLIPIFYNDHYLFGYEELLRPKLRMPHIWLK